MSLTVTTELGLSIAAKAKTRTGGIKTLAEGRSDEFRLNPFLINVEEGFNVREFDSPTVAEHIDTLARSIAEIGVQRALKLRMKGGKLFLKDGECRLRATIRAIEVYGAEIVTVPVKMAERSESDADAVLGILVENSGLEVTPLGKSDVIKRLKGFGWSDDQIAKKSGLSISSVARFLEMGGLPEEVKSLIRADTISASTALAVARDKGFDGAATVKAITDGATKVAALGRTRVTAKALATTPSLKATLTQIMTDAGVERMPAGESEAVTLTISVEEYEMICGMLKIKAK